MQLVEYYSIDSDTNGNDLDPQNSVECWYQLHQYVGHSYPSR